jgi:UDP-N-acetylglucosamine 2-epimerase
MKQMLKVSVLLLTITIALGPVISAAHAQQSPAEIGVALDGQNAIEFIGRIDQSMFDLTSYGYITYMGGLPSELLFAEDTPAMLRTETEARFTFMATGTSNGRSNYQNIFAATTSATFNIFYNETPIGANFDDRESFATGTLVASFEGRLYSMLNVQEPNIGVLLVHSDTTQVVAAPFTLNDQSYQIGHVNRIARFTLFGQGFRSSTEPLAAYYHMAGDVVSLGTLDQE